MMDTNELFCNGSSDEKAPMPLPPGHAIVAVVLQSHGRIALLKRSQAIRHDRGLWHCITGFVDAGISSQAQAIQELREETGLEEDDILALKEGPELLLSDGKGDLWKVHTFAATTKAKDLCLNWENDSYLWTTRENVKLVPGRVLWLDTVLDATEWEPDPGQLR